MLLNLHIVESAASDVDPSGFIIYKYDRIKTIGETKQNKRTKEVKGTTCKKNNPQQMIQTYVAQTGHRSKSCVCFACGPCPFGA